MAPPQIGRAKLAAYRAGLLVTFRGESDEFLCFVRLALVEAEALAWSTAYPHLFLPALAEEKIQYVRQWTRRQAQVTADSPRAKPHPE